MKIIFNDETIIIKRFIKPASADTNGLKWSQFNIMLDTEDGCLIYNTLSNSMVLIEGKSADEILSSDPDLSEDKEKLSALYMVIGKDVDEYKRYNDMRRFVGMMVPQKQNKSFTIFTTRACNARCPYCFEAGLSKPTMSEQTADDVLKFILDKNGDDDEIKLRWFGGEPLVNAKVIDRISTALADMGKDYSSKMITNAYLFDDDMIKRAHDLWKLKAVAITLDGTENVYNKTKGYVNAEGSPYRKVLDSIDKLMASGIHVNIRLNLSVDNRDDLMDLVDELSERWKDGPKPFVRVVILYEYRDDDIPQETHELISEYQQKLIMKLIDAGLYPSKIEKSKLRMTYCMADNDNAYCITPKGCLVKCEHCDENDAVGNIYDDITDEDTVAEYRVREKVEHCKDCVMAPTCYLVKKCHPCTMNYIEEIVTEKKCDMIAFYKKYKEA